MLSNSVCGVCLWVCSLLCLCMNVCSAVLTSLRYKAWQCGTGWYVVFCRDWSIPHPYQQRQVSHTFSSLWRPQAVVSRNLTAVEG